jgi:hypothetical protein
MVAYSIMTQAEYGTKEPSSIQEKENKQMFV